MAGISLTIINRRLLSNQSKGAEDFEQRKLRWFFYNFLFKVLGIGKNVYNFIQTG